MKKKKKKKKELDLVAATPVVSLDAAIAKKITR